MSKRVLDCYLSDQVPSAAGKEIEDDKAFDSNAALKEVDSSNYEHKLDSKI